MKKRLIHLILALVFISGIFLGFPKKTLAQPPTLVGVSAIGASTTGDFTITLPAHQANDILLAISWVRLSTATMATPAGWTLMTGTPFVRSTVARYYMFWKRATSSAETNPLFDTSGTDDHYAMVAVYRGVITTGDPFEASAVSTSAVDPSVFTGITTLTADALVVAAVGGEDNNNASIITTATNPAAFNESYLTSATGTDGAVSFNEAARTLAGATGSVSVDWVTAVPIGAGAIVLALKPVPPVTTISNFVTAEPSNSTIAPGASAQVDSFGLVASAGSSDTVTGATVTLAAGTGARVATVAITNDGDTVTYCSAAPSGDTATLTNCGIPVTDTNTQFKIKITAISHASMPVPSGAEYAVTGTVTAFTSGNSQSGTDSGSATVTIDNLSPGATTGAVATPGDTTITVDWTNPTDGDFQKNIIVCKTSTVLDADKPAEGTDPSVDGAACDATARVKFNGTGITNIFTGLTNGTTYYFRLFPRDTNGNFTAFTSTQEVSATPVSASPNITVGTSGTQTTPLIIPSTSNNVGGAFTFVRSSGTTNVTQIIITDNGTVNANLNLASVVLFYKTEATCSTSIPVDATQFNATGVGFNASEKATATGTMTVGTSQICVYVRLDAGSGASDGQTIEIRVANPSTEVTALAGTVSPATPVDIADTTTLEVPKITVATEGTQTSSMAIGVGDNHVGGAFSFTRNTASANVTSIIITDDTGTVNANANISDVVVFYKQEVTCSSSIPVDATQFNSTPASFNASEKATATGTMAVGTSKICVYVRVDVGDGATGGQTLEIEISNPSTEVTVSAGTVTPATAVAISGTTTLNLPTYTSQGMPFLYTANNWGTGGSGVSFFLEVYMRQTTGTVYARLLNETDTTAVSDSTLSTTSTSFTRLRTASALTLTDGKTYRVQFGKIGADAGETLGAKLVVNQNQGGGGGADLAEFYSSSDQLDLAEVVAIDRSQVAAVRRSDKPYQGDMLGVVATQPGIILGENVGQSYPIALVGRVPVKVTTENGQIRSGDYLTSSSVPGHAMRATKAGRVLGQALETLDPGKTHGTVMVFVNLIDYLGSSVELAMEEKNQVAYDDQGFKLEETQIPISSYTESIATSSASMQSDKSNRQQKILTFLKDLKESQNGMVSSEVFVGRVAATDEVITPLIFTDTLYAKKIKADSIEGLEIITGKISALSNQVAGVATPSAVLANNNIVQLGNITIESAKVSLDLIVLGKLETQGGLIVGGLAEFKSDTIFNSLAQFISKVIFKDNVLFEGRPTFNKDTAGFSVIKKDADNVEVVFEKEYATTPIVSVNMTFDPVKLADGNTEDPKILQKRISEGGYSYFVTNRSTRGFTIVLNKSSYEDLTFSWIALAVKDAKTAYSKELQSLTATVSATPIPSLIPTLPPPITPSPSESPSPLLQTLTIKENELGFLRVRSEPSTTSNEIGQVSPGQLFKVMETSEGWYKIEYTENKTGWVSATYVSIN